MPSARIRSSKPAHRPRAGRTRRIWHASATERRRASGMPPAAVSRRSVRRSPCRGATRHRTSSPVCRYDELLSPGTAFSTLAPWPDPHLFDAMAATYDDLEPWYEHLYARLHTILRAELGPAPARRPRARRRLRHRLPVGDPDRARLDDARHRPLGRAARRGPPRLPSAGLAQGKRRGAAVPRRLLRRRGLLRQHAVLRRRSRPCARRDGTRVGPGGRLLLDCEHRPSLDLAWALASAVAGDPLGYGVSARAAWRAVFARDGVRLPYPGYGLLRLFTRRELDRTADGRRAQAGPRVGPARRHQPAAIHGPAPPAPGADPRRALPRALHARSGSRRDRTRPCPGKQPGGPGGETQGAWSWLPGLGAPRHRGIGRAPSTAAVGSRTGAALPMSRDER